jgi:hypothetical protein
LGLILVAVVVFDQIFVHRVGVLLDVLHRNARGILIGSITVRGEIDPSDVNMAGIGRREETRGRGSD